MDLTISLTEPSIYTWLSSISIGQLLGVVIGGTITFFVGWYFRQREEKQHISDLRREAYIKFLSTPAWKESVPDGFEEVYYTVTRVMVYGSVEIQHTAKEYIDSSLKNSTLFSKMKEQIRKELKLPPPS